MNETDCCRWYWIKCEIDNADDGDGDDDDDDDDGQCY